MAFLRGVLGGAAALVLVWLSMFALSGTLHRLPWTRLVTIPVPQAPPVPPAADEIVAPEPARTAGRRGTTGSVPMYRERTPKPRWTRMPEEAPAPQRQPALKAAARPAARPGPASIVDPSRQRMQALQELGAQAGPPAGGAAAQAQAAGPALPAGPAASAAVQHLPAPAPPPEPEPEPQQGAWDQGNAEPEPASPKARRPMRALPQAGTVIPQQPAASEEEEDQ